MSDMPLELSEEIVEEIRLYLQKHDELFGNGSPEDIKERVFQTLKEHCIVMFYPIEDIEEKNDAVLFSGIPLKNGEKKDVVFINTFQTEGSGGFFESDMKSDDEKEVPKRRGGRRRKNG